MSILFWTSCGLLLIGCGTRPEVSEKQVLNGASTSSIQSRTAGKLTPAQLQFPVFKESQRRYAGSLSCLDCHRGTHEVYSHHPMANSTVRVEMDVNSDLPQEAEFKAATGLHYKVSKSEDGSIFHHECAYDPQGQRIYDQSVRVDLAMGSGVHGKSYLYEANGRMMQSPISWYAGADRWDLSPGYEGLSNPGFERLVAHDCLHCHIGEAHVVPGERYSLKNPAFGELGIGCERCHGPSQDHVDYHQIQRDIKQDEDPIIKLGELSGDRQDAVCFQCHMQGARRIPHVGASETSFRPGMAINEVWTLFLKSPGSDEIPIVSHGEQMHQSVCYQQSEAMTCVTCHDPHSRPAPGNRSVFYRNKCLTCHGEAGEEECAMAPSERLLESPDDSCIQCHMPKASAKSVPHTAHTNHAIPRNSDIPIPSDLSLSEVLEEESSVSSVANRQRARGIFAAEVSYSSGNRQLAAEAVSLLRPAFEAVPDDYEVAEALGRAYETLGKIPSAIQVWEQGLQSSPKDELLLLLLATASHSQDDFAKAEVYLRALMKINPARSLYPGRLTHVLGMQQKYLESMKTAKLALELKPSLIQAHQWLTMAYARQGEMEKSRYHEQQANKLKQAMKH